MTLAFDHPYLVFKFMKSRVANHLDKHDPLYNLVSFSKSPSLAPSYV